MATAPHDLRTPPLVGETVHYREHGRCWAAAVVEAGPGESVQLYLFPLPPTQPMPQAPGTFIGHDSGTGDETWHRLVECPDAAVTDGAAKPERGRRRRRRGGG